MLDSVNDTQALCPTLSCSPQPPTYGKIGKIVETVRCLGPRQFATLLLSMLFSVNHYYILGRNVAAPLKDPLPHKPKEELSPINEDDIAWIKNNINSLEREDRKEILTRIFFYQSGFKNCYVMRNENGIAYMQWIILPNENQVITSKYSGRFLPLRERQVMIENAFTFPSYRGRGYLPFATQQLMELGKNNGYTSAICYIKKNNIVSLNEFTKMGFKITKMVTEYKVLGRVRRTL